MLPGGGGLRRFGGRRRREGQRLLMSGWTKAPMSCVPVEVVAGRGGW